MITGITYREINASEVPDNVRFDVTRRNQGQMVEVAYGGTGRAEHDYGDRWKRITDRSDRTVTYYERVQGTQRKPKAVR